MEYIMAYLAYWSVLVMVAGFMALMTGIVMLLIPIFRAVAEYRMEHRFAEVRAEEKLAEAH